MIAVLMGVSGCAVLNKNSNRIDSNRVDLHSFCLEEKSNTTLLIDNIKADIEWQEEKYRAEINLYYIKDSALYFNAQKAGFELIRGVITADSMMLINRLDKLVYRYKIPTDDTMVPIDFQEVKLLVDKHELCGESNIFKDQGYGIRIDHSQKGIRSYINYQIPGLILQRFEFYNTRTDEYVVGERTGDFSFTVYANYIVKDMVIHTEGGRVRTDENVFFNMNYNRSRYHTITL